MNRLASIAPDFERKLRALTDAELKNCARIGCRTAALTVAATALQSTVLASILSESTICSRVIASLAAETTRWDDIYLDKYSADSSAGLTEFYRARLGMALGLLLTGLREDMVDCLYEACMSVDDPETVVKAVLPLLD